MIEAPLSSAASSRVAVLLHPSIVPVLDVFRSLSRLDDQYDLALLDGPEQSLATYIKPEAAKGIISDALLLAFALTRQRGRAFHHRPVGSRHGSIDEYCLLALISSSRNTASEVALEAASLLEIVSLDFMSALAGELVRQLDSGALVFEAPTLAEFRAIAGYGNPEDVMVEATLSKADFNRRI
jgi:hypothetical protein